MTTTVTINSLMRFDEDKQYTNEPNPFDFTIPSKITSNWVFERKPFSRTATKSVTDGFKVRALRVFIPKTIVPTHQPLFFLDIKSVGDSNIDKTIGPRIKNKNIIGATGLNGCVAYPDDLPNYNGTWPLYPSSAYSTHWIYESCAFISMNHDWKGRELKVKLRDSCGYVLTPPSFPADGISGFTGNLCDFKMDYCRSLPCGVTSGCKPVFQNPILPLPEFSPFFQKENQLMIILNVEYVLPDGGVDPCSIH